MYELILEKIYRLTQDTPLFPKGTKFMHIIARETEKAWGISRGLPKHQSKKLLVFQRRQTVEYKGFVFLKKPTFWLPKSQVTKVGNSLKLPDWLAEKYGLDLLQPL